MTQSTKVAILLLALVLMLSGTLQTAANQQDKSTTTASAASVSPTSTPEPEVFRSGDYTYILDENGTAVITSYKGNAAKLTVPATIDDRKLTGIGRGAFSGCNSLTAVTLSEGLTNIGDNAFCSCKSLTAVNLPDSLTVKTYEGDAADCYETQCFH